MLDKNIKEIIDKAIYNNNWQYFILFGEKVLHKNFFSYYQFWNEFYDRIKFNIPNDLKPVLNLFQNYFQLQINNTPTFVHYEFIYNSFESKRIKLCFHVENRNISDCIRSNAWPFIDKNDINYSIIFNRFGYLIIEKEIDINNSASELVYLYDLTINNLNRVLESNRSIFYD